MKNDRIAKLQRRAVQLRGELEEVGPVIFGTVAAKTQKSRRKDGSFKVCPSPSVNSGKLATTCRVNPPSTRK